MLGTFRAAMTWLHTWFGMVLGFVLMVVFFFGSLSVFDREIDRWAIPESRFEPQPMPSFDALLAPIFEGIEPDQDELAAARERVGTLESPLPLMNWSAYVTHRDPVLTLYAEFAVTNNPRDPGDHVHGHVTIDPGTGAALPHDALKVGSRFFFPLHYGLHLNWLDLGYWIVGLAALVMLAALVSGVVMHRKLFRELFTLRFEKRGQRRLLDLHNLTGVAALPFHFMFSITGLVIMAGTYLPVSQTMFEKLALGDAVAQAATKGLAFEPSGVAGGRASVDAMMVEAKRRWAARGMPGEVGYLSVQHLGDAQSYVSLYRAGSDRVALVGQAIHFEAATGRVIYEEPPPSAISAVSEFLMGLHLQHFEHWLLRWLYLLGGLLGCVCIGTGLVFFVNKRKAKHAVAGLLSVRAVDALSAVSMTGMVIATVALLAVTHALPASWPSRETWQTGTFWSVWLLTALHAAWRSGARAPAGIAPLWREQCWAIAVLCVLALGLNWARTGDHLGKTLLSAYWPVFGVDLALLAGAATALAVARRLRLHRPVVPRNTLAAKPSLLSDRGLAHG